MLGTSENRQSLEDRPLFGPAMKQLQRFRRRNEFRENLPLWDLSDTDAKNAFIILMSGILLNPILLYGNCVYARSPNKRAAKYASRALCLGVLFFTFGLICVHQIMSPSLSNKVLLMERVTKVVTCGKRQNPCCARAGVLERFVDSCDNVGYIDPTGHRCIEDTFGICTWLNGSATSTMSLHCHSQGPDDPKPHCHFHKAPHILGSEPGDVL